MKHPAVHRSDRVGVSRWSWLAVAAVTASMAGAASGQFSPGGNQPPRQITADQLVDMRLLADQGHVVPGETFHVIAVFDIERPWHLYWKNPGEAGALPPSVDITAPAGFDVGEMRWPRPKRINSPAGEMFCYERQLALFIPITAPTELDGEEVKIEARIRFAVCNAERCLIGQGTRGLTIPTTSAAGDGSAATSANRHAELIERHRPRLSRQINDADNASIELRVETLSFTVPAHGHERATFFPLESPGVRYGKPEMTFDADVLTVSVALTINPNNFRGGPPKVGGLIALGREPDGLSYEGAVSLSR